MKKIKINDTTIRDTFQNINSDYIDTKSLDPLLHYSDNLNFDSMEVWGGASFEKILESNLRMSPWDMLCYIKSKIPSIPLQALMSAKSLVNFEIYSKNIIEKFIKQCTRNGVDIFRVYDPLNNLDNLNFATLKVVENGGKCQGTIIYDNSKNTDFYIEVASKLGQFGCSSICIKDIESTLLPKKTAELFKTLKQKINIPLFLSTYNLRGLQMLNYYQACTSGCDGIDLSFIPSSYTDFTSSYFPFFLGLKNTNISHSLDYLKVLQLYENTKKYIYPHLKKDLFSPNFTLSSTNKNLLPKWLLSSLNRQLCEIGEAEKLDLIIEEIFKIKNEVGNPSLATPIGQIIASQAILNTIISDYRWEIVSDEMKKLLQGYYGKLPQKPDRELIDKLSDSIRYQENGTSFEAEDIYKQCKNELEGLSSKEEDILSYCLFPEKTRKFLEQKKGKKDEVSGTYIVGTDTSGITQKVETGSSNYKLQDLDIKKIKEISNLVESSNIDEIKLELDGVKISINKFRRGPEKYEQSQSMKLPDEKASDENIIEVKSPIVGTFYRASAPNSPPLVNVGDKVKKGDTICIIEAMKLMNKVTSGYDGEIKDIVVKNEEAVEFNQTIMLLKL